MTYPGDDEYVTIEPEDYAAYDAEWWANAPRERVNEGMGAGYDKEIRDLSYHPLWDDAQRDGWQSRNNVLLKTPTRQRLQTRSTGWAARQRQYIQAPGYEGGTWIHIVEQPTEKVAEYGDVVRHLFQHYPTLGDALDGARTRERSLNYGDYQTMGEGPNESSYGALEEYQ